MPADKSLEIQVNMPYPLIRATLREHQWAILEDYGRAFYSVLEGRQMNVSQLAQAAPAQLRTEYLMVEKRRTELAAEGIALIPVMGPLMPWSHAAMCGYVRGSDAIAADFKAAMEDPNINSVILFVSSPGGAVEGTSELSDLIYDARGQKRVTAYVSGLGASAAYWIASAASEIVVSKNAQVGSVGVLLISDPPEEGAEPIVIKSSGAPRKHMALDSEEGKGSFQNLANEIEDVMVSDIARNRNTTSTTVLKDFGEGFIRHGKDAVAFKMADRVSNFEAVVKEHITNKKKGARSMSGEKTEDKDVVTKAELNTATETAKNEGHQQGLTTGAENERTRLKAIEDLKVAAGYEHIVTANKYKPEATAESISALVTAAMAKDNATDAEALKPAAEGAAKSAPSAEDARAKKMQAAFAKGAHSISHPLARRKEK